MKAPQGSYLILARPRSRTGWLTALLFGDIPCYHDEIGRLDILCSGGPFGFASPSIALMSHAEVFDVFADCPVVVVDRPAAEAYPAFERFLGFEVGCGLLERRFTSLRDLLPARRQMTVPYASLDEYETVNRIHQHCLGRSLDRNRFHAFNLLRIEQHVPKVKENTPSDVFRRLDIWPG